MRADVQTWCGAISLHLWNNLELIGEVFAGSSVCGGEVFYSLMSVVMRGPSFQSRFFCGFLIFSFFPSSSCLFLVVTCTYTYTCTLLGFVTFYLGTLCWVMPVCFSFLGCCRRSKEKVIQMQHKYLLQPAVPKATPYPLLCQNKNSQHLPGTQVYTTHDTNYKNQRWNQKFILQKTTTELADIPPTLIPSQHMEQHMTTHTTYHWRKTPQRSQNQIHDLR